jgi:hypothetical protein
MDKCPHFSVLLTCLAEALQRADHKSKRPAKRVRLKFQKLIPNRNKVDGLINSLKAGRKNVSNCGSCSMHLFLKFGVINTIKGTLDNQREI